jgi:hypothetical protein
VKGGVPTSFSIPDLHGGAVAIVFGLDAAVVIVAAVVFIVGGGGGVGDMQQ